MEWATETDHNRLRERASTRTAGIGEVARTAQQRGLSTGGVHLAWGLLPAPMLDVGHTYPLQLQRLLRLLAGGLASSARRRSRLHRAQHPIRCSRCGSAQPCVLWMLPGADHPGQAWCAACLGPEWRLAPLWRAGPAGLGGREEDSVGPPLSLALAALMGNLAPGPRTHDTCPLCGYGTAGSEHLLTWCRAPVAAAATARGASADCPCHPQ